MGVLCIVLYGFFEKAVIILFGISLIFEGVVSLVTIIIDSRAHKRMLRDLARIERDRPID